MAGHITSACSGQFKVSRILRSAKCAPLCPAADARRYAAKRRQSQRPTSGRYVPANRIDCSIGHPNCVVWLALVSAPRSERLVERIRCFFKLQCTSGSPSHRANASRGRHHGRFGSPPAKPRRVCPDIKGCSIPHFRAVVAMVAERVCSGASGSHFAR